MSAPRKELQRSERPLRAKADIHQISIPAAFCRSQQSRNLTSRRQEISGLNGRLTAKADIRVIGRSPPGNSR